MDTKLSTHHHFRRMFTNILKLVVIQIMILANTGFSVQAEPHALPGDWDGNSVMKASVLQEPGGYRMWYDGVNLSDQTQIGLATSTNGLSWVKYSGNPVLVSGPAVWDSSGEHAPFVMKDGDLYKMWYEGSNGGVRQLGYATSSDGITWTKYAANPVLQAGPQGYDQNVAGHGTVLHENGLYKLWYHAIGTQGIIIAYATSADGINWTKVGPVLLQENGNWDENGLWGPSVLKINDTYWMWYSAGSPIYPTSIGVATSTNGVQWSRVGDAPVITYLDNHIGDPHVIYATGIFKMWFTNFSDGAIYYAESTNGLNWTVPIPVLLPGSLQSSFVDVPTTYWAWSWIERLYDASITGGCVTDPLQYCPDASVTRAQMAIFLEKGLYYPNTFSPPNLSPTFNDTVGHWAEDWIEALRSDGITGGCGPNLYCPEDAVTRAQMAVFLLKSKYGSGYSPPAVGSSTGFADVPVTHWAAAWIKQLAAEGITGGCGTGTYCPDSPVTRAQMAVFLVRTFSLP